MKYRIVTLLLFNFGLCVGQDFGNNPNAGKYITINGIKIYCEIYGNGTPLLLLHGNSQSIHDYQYQIPEFLKYFKVIVPDSRAQGKSGDSSLGITYDLMADDMSLLLDSIGIKNCIVLGWSDGGNTGLSMAIHHPDKITKLITVGANYKIDSTAVGADILEVLQDDLEKEENPQQKKLIEMMLHYPKLTEAQLNTIKIPVMVMAGEFDIIKRGHTQKLSQSIPNSKLEIVKEAGHFIPHENPELFNQLVLNYLEVEKPKKIIGSLKDTKSKEPIISANVYFKKSKEGTSSDLEGNFELNPSLLQNDTLVISSIGYESFQVASLAIGNLLNLTMKPIDYILKTVTIRSKPLTATAILTQAIKNLSKNYPQDKYGFEMYVNQRWEYKDGKPPTVAEGFLQGYNQTGYSRRVHASFHLLNKMYFKLVEQRRQNVKDSAWVMHYVSDMMYREVIRFSNNPINKGNLKNFNININDIKEGKTDTIFVISFKCKDPNYWNTGHFYTTEYFGEIHIDSKDFAIVKFKATNIADKDIIEKNGKKSRFLSSNLQEQYEINYVKAQGVYFPSQIKNFSFTYKGNNRVPENTFKSETIIYSLSLKDPTPIESPKKFKSPPIKNVPFNDQFWKNFSIPKALSPSNP